jgi:hypothetical protein
MGMGRVYDVSAPEYASIQSDSLLNTHTGGPSTVVLSQLDCGMAPDVQPIGIESYGAHRGWDIESVSKMQAVRIRRHQPSPCAIFAA